MAKDIGTKDKTPDKDDPTTPTTKELPPNAPQGDFHITIVERIKRTATYVVPISRDAVVADLKLTPDQTEFWGAHVHAYVPGHWDELKPLSTLDGEATEELLETEFTKTEYRGPKTASVKKTSEPKPFEFDPPKKK